MRMRKNFALIAVLAIAVFVASAGLVSSAETSGCKTSVDCTDMAKPICHNGVCVHASDVPEDERSVIGSGSSIDTTSDLSLMKGDYSCTSGNCDLVLAPSSNGSCEDGTCDIPPALEYIGNGSDCPDGTCDIPDMIVNVPNGGNVRYEPANGQDILQAGSSAKFSCNGDSFRVTKVGSGNSGDRAEITSGPNDCPRGMVWDSEEERCTWPEQRAKANSDNECGTPLSEGCGPDEVCNDGKCEQKTVRAREQGNDGFLSSFFTANN